MPEYCSCGAELPPDALFCHKCGKPQRYIQPVETEEPPAEVPPIAPRAVEAPQPLPLNFHNRIALRIVIVVALVATCLFFLPYVNWLAAGYFAVFFYTRRTGQPLNFGLGVRMGWMTGIVIFIIDALMIGLFALFLSAVGGMSEFQAQLRSMADPRTQERIQEALRLFQNRGEVIALLVQLFIFITFLSMAGGALAAKLVGRT